MGVPGCIHDRNIPSSHSLQNIPTCIFYTLVVVIADSNIPQKPSAPDDSDCIYSHAMDIHGTMFEVVKHPVDLVQP